MIKKYVVAYYGDVYQDMFFDGEWSKQYVGQGIVHESKKFDHPPETLSSCLNLVGHYAPKDKEYDYAKIEERYYKS
ncbi:hypothetical protein [Bacillus licheniformis]|uniref:hypothetical protein n=2 Tax=Bacillota TaxID=1239 RepID=UPI00092959C6|nr:hypothetical protein [Bacillus licheniformis]NFT30655.1 hypothetical protein [Clostridium sporogenes]OJT57400.1 hypothetical protein BFP47_11890 [Bacillus licheniformis]OJT69958.1 hypothetical protein BFP46_05000 [Bacillus licheniformis]TWM14800.1 hypothetical protein CHCC15091_1841 [Bacillus licheniformis]GIN25445.1 hypothetical protein J31TS2_20250 [Bacillus licheniformis]